MKIDFQGSRITSRGGLILVRELDQRLGFGELIEQPWIDSRGGKNTQFRLSIACDSRSTAAWRLRGCQRPRVAEPRSKLPADRVGEDLTSAALTSGLPSLGAEMMAAEKNSAGLARIHRELLGRVEAGDSPQRVVLEVDSTEIPVYGQQEQSASNGQFQSTC